MSKHTPGPYADLLTWKEPKGSIASPAQEQEKKGERDLEALALFFSELRKENERLRRQVKALRARLPADDD